MKAPEFNDLLEGELSRVKSMLGSKAEEYASDKDRLHNFNQAAALQQQTPEQALGGMMAKHTVSIYDMIESGEEFPLEQWTEKITDHLNYLVLLKAIVVERARKKEPEGIIYIDGPVSRPSRADLERALR